IGGRPVHARRAVELVVQMADALSEAHASGLIHGDVRPDTIAVTQKGSAKLLDFGMSRWTRGGAIRARAASAPDSLGADAAPVVGYLSPEQALGGLVDVRTDVFSLGVVLFEMLTGQNPFAGRTPGETVVNIISKVPPPPSSLNPEVPADLDAIVLRALAKDIEIRQQSAAAFSAELRSVGAMLEVRAGETSAGDLMPLDDEDEGGAGKWIAAAVVLGALAVGAWWFLG
ncbi:MAG TPA: serine/threonine-protein kinase, partial [Thermohalobaculum sp.]|nr:serine/threonine-protein kinase [Thermohalobaculum sp.]